MFNWNPCRRGWHSHLTISIYCMLIKSLILRLKLTSGIFGHFNYPFPKYCLLQRQRKHRVRQGCHLHRYPSSNTAGIIWGTRRSRGEHRPMSGIYFVFHTPAVAPLPAAGSPRAVSIPAIPLAATEPAATGTSHFGLLPLHILSQAGREFPCHTPGCAHSTGYQLCVQAEMPVSLGKVPTFSPHIYQVRQNWVFVHSKTAWSFTS